jgi:hypothetical protein
MRAGAAETACMPKDKISAGCSQSLLWARFTASIAWFTTLPQSLPAPSSGSRDLPSSETPLRGHSWLLERPSPLLCLYSLPSIMREQAFAFAVEVGYGCGNPNINHDWLATQCGYSSVI